MNTPKIWTKENIKKIKKLHKKGLTSREIANQLNITRNSALGILYREKIKAGHIPNGKTHTHPNESMIGYFTKIGKSDCMMCKKKFDIYSKFDRFCNSCKNTSMYRCA